MENVNSIQDLVLLLEYKLHLGEKEIYEMPYHIAKLKQKRLEEIMQQEQDASSGKGKSSNSFNEAYSGKK